VTNDDIARAILDAGIYVVLATADADGMPWASPVWFAKEDYEELYWVSYPGARHSQNIAVRPQIAMVVFDSTVPPGTGQGVYMTATAEQLTDAITIEHGIVFSRESVRQGARSGGLTESAGRRGSGCTGRTCTSTRSSTRTSRSTFARTSGLDRADCQRRFDQRVRQDGHHSAWSVAPTWDSRTQIITRNEQEDSTYRGTFEAELGSGEGTQPGKRCDRRGQPSRSAEHHERLADRVFGRYGSDWWKRKKPSGSYASLTRRRRS
jgi:Pyridoxamine 5'-phosphate oxidase